jgi:hypothetical protein
MADLDVMTLSSFARLTVSCHTACRREGVVENVTPWPDQLRHSATVIHMSPPVITYPIFFLVCAFTLAWGVDPNEPQLKTDCRKTTFSYLLDPTLTQKGARWR